MAQTTLIPYNNRNLFSNYYLDNRVKTIPEWKKNDHIAAYSEIKKLYEEERKSFENFNEAQLIKHFLDPIFKILLFEPETEEAAGSEFPDFALFKDKNSRDEAHKNKGTISFYTNVLAIGEAKKWDTELDGKPIHQLRNYLDVTERKWGILTNGRKWRLFCKEKRRDDYYEVDLPSLLDNNDVEGFKYFFSFFRRDAFLLPDSFLDRVLHESEDHAKTIGNNLKENVYKAMKKIADGFFGRPQNNLDRNDGAARERVQKNTMLLLYRLLFLLYAEDRNLLDIKNTKYLTNHSFRRIKQEVKDKRGRIEQGYDNSSTTIWDRLKNLFELINFGSEALGEKEFHVPAYNGGLFDTKKNPELDEKWKIGDRYLADAIHLLTWSDINGAGGFVDYSELEIRHLGSIYEGLLEYKLNVAEADIVTKENEWVSLEKYNEGRKQKKTFEQFDEFSRAKKGELYLATDKGERKATGSYYTPDYIVNYIVRNTIEPVVAEKWKEAQEKNKSFVDAALSVKVLDPAMGSGHFLVGAVDFLADKLLSAAQKDIEAKRLADEPRYYDQDWARREVVAHCIYGVDLNPMAVELAKVSLWLKTISREKPLSFLDHRLKQGNSLMGARLIELAYYPKKISEKGDKRQRKLPSFITEIFIKHLIGKISELEKIGDDKLEDIKRKERVFTEFKELDEYKKAKAIANVNTAVFFGNEVVPTEKKDSANVYYDLMWSLQYPSNWEPKTRQMWFKQAQEIAEQKSFFHWELEFPEIFFEGGAPKKNPGWDAVVGNPPYIRIQELNKKSPDDVNYYSIKYEIASRKYDIYILFVEQSYYLCNQGSRIGFIMPVKFVNADYGRGLRNFILQKKILKELVDLSSIQVFDEATTYTGLFIFSKDSHQQFSYWKVNEITTKLPNGKQVIIPYDSFDLDKTWVLGEKEQTSIIANIGNISTSIKLNDVVDRIFQGINSGADSVFVLRPISQSKDGKIIKVFSKELGAEVELEAELLHPVLKGSEVNRYEIQEPDSLVLYLYVLDTDPHGHSQSDTRPLEESELQTRFPLTWRYISSDPVMLRLKSRKYLMNAIEGGKMGYTKWYEMWKQRRLSWMASRKILTQVLSKENAFSLDESGKLFFVGGGTAGCNGIVMKNTELSDYFIISILNSHLANFQIKAISIKFRGDYFSTGGKGSLTDFPIRRISFTTPPARRAALFEEAKALYSTEAPDSGCPAFKCGVMDFVGARLEAKPEESDVVHDLLAHLAERMIEMNKKKNEEIKGFLEWLERELGAHIDMLTNRTILKQYHELDFDGFLSILKKNKTKISANLSGKDFQKNLMTEFEKSRSKLAPLTNEIKATDDLIDAIVYRLYGLTEEEIRIVEESISGDKDREVSK